MTTPRDGKAMEAGELARELWALASEATPGPWLVEDRLIYTLQNCMWLGIPSKENRSSAGFQGHKAPEAEHEANAKLFAFLGTHALSIAAALEELAELKDNYKLLCEVREHQAKMIAVRNEELTALRKDKERLDWLHRELMPEDIYGGSQGKWVIWNGQGTESYDLRMAIDGAMAEEDAARTAKAREGDEG